MKTLISNARMPNLGPQFSSQNFLFHFPSLSRKNPHLRSFTHRKWLYFPRTLTFCLATSSDSLSYNGWDDPRLGGGSAQSGESNQLHNLLNSLGLDDRRYIFVYLLGFICALAVSRIRVSSIVVFSACAILFAVGFSIGFINGGYVNELSLMGTKKRLKDDTFRASIEKLRNSVVLFDGCDSKISNLKNVIRRAIESNHITVSNLENYVEVLESIGLSALSAKSVVETCVDSISIENPEVERLSTLKSSKRKKEVGESGIDLLKFAGNLFQKNSAYFKSNKIKEGIMKDSVHLELNDQSRGNILAPSTEDNVVYNNNAEFSGNNYSSNDGFHETAENVENDISFSDVGSGAGRVFHSEKYSYQSNRLRSVSNQRISLKMGPRKEVETWAQNDNFLDSVDFSVDLKRMGNELFEKREQILGKTNASYRPIHSRDSREKEIYETHNEEEERMILDDDPNTVNYSFGQKNDDGSFPSSLVSDDIVFNKYLMEANSLLKEARKFLRVKSDEGQVETLLYDAAKLFSKAIDMKPMSLLAVGQLGNTYLLHGELKLKRSRRLRALLAESDQLSVGKRGKVLEGIDDQVERRDRIASLLICVCEECEELLVEAGRKYRLALSIDGNDMRALYNWGLALSFRAQLIADIGPDAAFDADKVFLAAIDKFDAMMCKSNAYAPDALFRWGAALQQRSRLRPRNKNEKVKLLQQAKRLYEDALDMDSDNLQVREALCSCISELSFRSY